MKNCKQQLYGGCLKSAGFTLIEMSIVILISGLFLVLAAKTYSVQVKKLAFDKTIDNLTQTQRAMDEYFFRSGRYPCPADPTLPPTDSMFGREWCTDVPPLAPHPPGPSANVVYTTVGARDADGVGGPDTVAIGIVPFLTLDEGVVNTPYSIAEGYDAYGHAFSYAVSDTMTRNSYNYGNPVQPRLGAVNVRDSNNISVVSPDSSAHYVLFSHGETAEGAYTKQGARIGTCFVPLLASVPPAGYNPGTAGIMVELENCDNNDAIFVKELTSYANNDNFNDDILHFGMNSQYDLWRVSAFSPGTDTYYFNTNLGSVAAGSLTPTTILYVSGSIRAENRMESGNRFCPITYSSSDDCVNPQFLGGPGHSCASGWVATGIERNQLVCRQLLSGPPNFITYCSGGEFMKGFTIDGAGNANPDCETP